MKNEVRSIKRWLSIVEKILIIFLAFISFPLGLSVSTFFVSEINPFSLSIFPILSGAWAIIFLALIFLEFYFKNVSLYKGLIKSSITSFILSFTITFSIFCLFFIWGKYSINYVIFATFISLSYFFILTLIRILLIILNKNNKKIALIIGPKDDADLLAKKLIKENSKTYRIKYVFYEKNLEISSKVYDKFVECNTVILLNTLSFKNKQKFLLYFNSNLNKDVFLCTTYFDIVLAGNSVSSINDVLSYEQKPLTIDIVEAFVKRTIDIIASTLILILSSPIWMIIPLLIKIQDGGPVFYKQVRLTKNMKEFNILKFRSMKVDAEKNGAQLATSNDSRVTKVGKIIRATRIDEIPQVLNVLKGDMSLVGPRPERPEFVEGFLKDNPLYKYRFNVKAGVTGLQQVSTTYHTSYDDKLRYDLFYISNYNVVLDIAILFQTVKTVLSKSMAEGVSEDIKLPFSTFLLKQGLEFKDDIDYIHIKIKKGGK